MRTVYPWRFVANLHRRVSAVEIPLNKKEN
jgi:hypothetical protein